jgi:hypothetical protein
MAPDDLAVYPTWDLTRPPRPVRSALYPLAPLGVGTRDVESLTSYLTRLAAAHSVSPRTLVIHAIAPLVGGNNLRRLTTNRLAAFWMTDACALNGTGATAHGWAQAVATLTGRPEIPFLTMLTWREVLPFRGLLRRVHAWCPVCYEEWQTAGTPVYDPLRWTLAIVTGCPRHRRLLRQECPHPGCRQSQPPVAARSRSGHCSACGGWLGASVEFGGGEEIPSIAELTWQSWVENAVGTLLAASPLATPPPRERIAHRIKQCIGSPGGLTAFAHALQLNPSCLCQWGRGTHLPSITVLVDLCYRLDIPLRDFLLAEPVRINPAPIHPRSPPGVPREPAAGHKPFEANRVRGALEDILQSSVEPPPSVCAVARHLGYAYNRLQYRFPDLCRAISARYLAHRQRSGERRLERLRNEVREVTCRLHAQGVYPSSVRVAILLTHPSNFRNPVANAAWHTALRDLGWKS